MPLCLPPSPPLCVQVAAEKLPRYTVLGAYAGKLQLEAEYFAEHSGVLNRMQADRFSFPAMKFIEILRRLRQGINGCHVYSEDMLATARRLVADELGDPQEELLIVPHVAYPFSTQHSLKLYGNEGQAINDCVQGDPSHLRLNSLFAQVTYRGWPYVFVVTDEEILEGQEVFLSYGKDFWKKEHTDRKRFQGTEGFALAYGQEEA